MSGEEQQKDTDTEQRRVRWRTTLSDTEEAQTLLFHNHLLGDRLRLLAVARFIVIAGMIAAAFFARHVVGIENLDVARMVWLAISLGLVNVCVYVLVVRCAKTPWTPQTRAFGVRVMHGNIALDFIFLTVALWLVGGAKSPFQAFYLFHVILASVFLSRRAAYTHTLIGYGLLSALIVAEWQHWIPAHYPSGIVAGGGSDLDGRFVLTVLTVQGLLFILTVLILAELMQLFRANERKFRKVNVELERLSEMHRDFLRIALHNLKSPVSAVTTMLSSMEYELDGELSDHQAQWLVRSRGRLKGLTEFLRDLQTMAALDAGQISEQTRELDMADILRDLAHENTDLAWGRGQTLSVDVPPGLPTVHGIEWLLREAIVNFITNAVKYTPEGGRITLRALVRDNVFCVEVEDDGIGIAAEDASRVFLDFVRVQRDDTSGGPVEGTGLGLAIVKRVIEAHGGRVDVVSELNKGSTFIIELPL